jgi:hypothetical protein
VDAFLLKITIEERLGYPVQLISDGSIESIDSALNISDKASLWSALATGALHIYPEARSPANLSTFLQLGMHRSGGERVVW